MIIGIIGYAGAGKSTVADHLVRSYGYIRRPFAYNLKAMMSALGVPLEIINGNADAKAQPLDILCGHTARHAMQTLGTEWGRKCMGENFWVELWENSAPPSKAVVADDVRFPNEVQAIHNQGGIVIKVVRPGLFSDGHASEKADELEYDYLVENTGTLSDLLAAVDTILATDGYGAALDWLKRSPAFFEKDATEDVE